MSAKPRRVFHLLRKTSHWSKLMLVGVYVVGSCTNIIEKFPQAASCAADLLVLPFVPYVNDAILSASPPHRDRITDAELVSLSGQIIVKISRPLDVPSFQAICTPRVADTCSVNMPGVPGLPEWDGFGSQPEGIVTGATISKLVAAAPIVILSIDSGAVAAQLANQPCFDFTYFLRGSGGLGGASIGTTDRPLKIQVDGGTREVGPFISTVTVCKPTGPPPTITAASWIDAFGEKRDLGKGLVPPHAPIILEFSRPLAWAAPIIQSLSRGTENDQSRYELTFQELVISPNDGKGFDPEEQNRVVFPRKTTLRTFNTPPSTVSEDGQEVATESLPTFTSAPARILRLESTTGGGAADRFGNVFPELVSNPPPFVLRTEDSAGRGFLVSTPSTVGKKIFVKDRPSLGPAFLPDPSTGYVDSLEPDGSGTLFFSAPGEYVIATGPRTTVQVCTGTPTGGGNCPLSTVPVQQLTIEDYIRIDVQPPPRPFFLVFPHQQINEVFDVIASREDGFVNCQRLDELGGEPLIGDIAGRKGGRAIGFGAGVDIKQMRFFLGDDSGFTPVPADADEYVGEPHVDIQGRLTFTEVEVTGDFFKEIFGGSCIESNRTIRPAVRNVVATWTMHPVVSGNRFRLTGGDIQVTGDPGPFIPCIGEVTFRDGFVGAVFDTIEEQLQNNDFGERAFTFGCGPTETPGSPAELRVFCLGHRELATSYDSLDQAWTETLVGSSIRQYYSPLSSTETVVYEISLRDGLAGPPQAILPSEPECPE